MSAYQTTDPHRWSTADTLAGFLATLSMFASALGLIWRPVRIIPFAILLVGIPIVLVVRLVAELAAMLFGG